MKSSKFFGARRLWQQLVDKASSGILFYNSRAVSMDSCYALPLWWNWISAPIISQVFFRCNVFWVVSSQVSAHAFPAGQFLFDGSMYHCCNAASSSNAICWLFAMRWPYESVFDLHCRFFLVLAFIFHAFALETC